jgi:transcriptional regulator with XRE-family HTH domain
MLHHVRQPTSGEDTITQLPKRIGSRLFEMRQAAQLSQERLAAAAELSTNYISLIEKGQRLPSLEALSQLARVLGVSVTAFLEEEEAPEGTLDRELRRLTAYLRRRPAEEVRKLRAIARILFAD